MHSVKALRQRSTTRARLTWFRRPRELFIAPAQPETGTHAARQLGRRGFDAVVRTVMCFAAVHLALLATYAASTGDIGVLSIFSIVEADRIWPQLASRDVAPWVSLFAVLCVYAAAFTMLARRSQADSPFQRSSNVVANGAPVPAEAVPRAALGARVEAPHTRATRQAALRPGLAAALAVAVGGVGVHMGSLALIELLVPRFPSVPDVFQARLPHVDFGVPGELVFVSFIVTSATLLISRQPRAVSPVICLLGAFYAIRGLFLFVLPIGSPPTAPALADRFVFYPYASHAYFPGGHAGLMTILSLTVADRRWRRGLLAVAIVFAFGTVVARAHYTADVLGGWVLGYALVCWGRNHLAHLSPDRAAPGGMGGEPIPGRGPRPMARRTAGWDAVLDRGAR